MKFPLVCLGAAAALTLAACGDRATDMSVPDIPDLPLQTPLQAYQAPVVPLQTTIHVGADVAASADALQQAGPHGETRVFLRLGAGWHRRRRSDCLPASRRRLTPETRKRKTA